MKISKFLAIILLSVTLLSSCSNNLNILAPYKDTTVVYGLLDQNDAVHYVRINKAFEGNGNAYVMAQVYDSINYPYATLNVSVLDYNSNGVLVNTYKLDSTTTIPLSAGIFSYPHQILYYFNAANLNPTDQFTLQIVNEKTGKTITGSTSLLSDITFNSIFPGQDLPLSFYPLNPTSVSWYSTQNGRLYQMSITFYYSEITSQGTTHKSLDWVMAPETAPGLSGGYLISYDLTAKEFFQVLNSSITASQSITRTADSFHVVVVSGSDDLNTYLQLSQPPTGIDQDVPTFSDINNAIGIFTSRHTQTFSTQVSLALGDSLKSDPLTQALNFLN